RERLHTLRDRVGEEHHFAVDMPRRATGCLDQRSLAAQKSFLVRVQDAHKRNLREIEAFAQQINADENVEFRSAQSAQNFHALNRVDIAMQVAYLQSNVAQIVGQIFRGSLGQRG